MPHELAQNIKQTYIFDTWQRHCISDQDNIHSFNMEKMATPMMLSESTFEMGRD